MTALSGRVLQYFDELPEGTPVAAKDLLHLGNHAEMIEDGLLLSESEPFEDLLSDWQ